MQALYAGLKSYSMATEEKTDVKFKSVIQKEQITKPLMERIVDAKGLIVERRTDLRSTGRGIEVNQTSVTAGGFKAAINYKFKLLENGDIRTFD